MILYETIDGLPYDQFVKNLNIKVCIYPVANAWEQIQSSSLQKAWNTLLGSKLPVMIKLVLVKIRSMNSYPDSELGFENFIAIS